MAAIKNGGDQFPSKLGRRIFVRSKIQWMGERILMSSLGNVLVTGSSGFIGRRLLMKLRNLIDGNVTLLLRTSSQCPLGTNDRDIIRFGTPTVAALKTALAGRHFDTVFHLAAAGTTPSDRDPQAMIEGNVLFPTALIAALASVSQPVFVSLGSCSEYAAPNKGVPLIESDPLETSRLYGASKAAGTLATAACATNLTLPFAILRAFNVYGPGEAAHRLLPSLIDCLKKGNKVSLSQGTQIRDFVYVDDVVEGLLAMAHHLVSTPPSSGIFNICTGKGTSVAEFARCAAHEIGADETLLKFGELPLRADDVAWQIGSTQKLHETLGWVPSIDIGKGLKMSISEHDDLICQKR